MIFLRSTKKIDRKNNTRRKRLLSPQVLFFTLVIAYLGWISVLNRPNNLEEVATVAKGSKESKESHIFLANNSEEVATVANGSKESKESHIFLAKKLEANFAPVANGSKESKESNICLVEKTETLLKTNRIKPTATRTKSTTPEIVTKSISITEVTPERKLSLPRVLAIVFPQYHRDPLNDKFWGKGFTDWDSLRKAPEKNRLGYAIPRPTESKKGGLGYYDLTELSPRKSQGELARKYGIDGLIYHHYWFYDKTRPGPSLHAPLEKMLVDGYPDIPFCLNWCATKWMNTWHGETAPGYVMPKSGVLQLQDFPENSTDTAITTHYNWLRQFFHHPNYITVHGGKPLFMLYNKKPRSLIVVKRLRALAIADGFPGLYVTIGLTKPHRHLETLENPKETKFQLARRAAMTIFDKTVAYPNPYEWNTKVPLILPQWCIDNNKIRDGGHNTAKRNTVKRNKEISGILTSFDNTPRRSCETATLWSADEPDVVVARFEQSLEAALYYETCCFLEEDETTSAILDDDSRFIVINSMNEWAEGMAMEPSDVFGHRFLEAVLHKKQDLIARGCNR